jgi:transposase InsO family protein
MPWKEHTCMSQREEFVRLALAGQQTFTALCEAFGVSRNTGYEVLQRFRSEGLQGLADHSRKPRSSPRRTAADVEAKVCELRRQRPTWGGRKIHHRLRLDGEEHVPAYSTITGILDRNGLLLPERRRERDLQRFEAEAPNDLWQMDFKGHFPTTAGRCYPLTVLDDHSRFNLCLAACPNERTETVQLQLARVFQLYGLPKRLLADNGSPWGSDQQHQYTRLTAWLIRLGISVSHIRPYHPQTQGKDERFHRTLKQDLLVGREWSDLSEAQRAFDPYRDFYNHYRPHQAIGDLPPATRYQASTRAYPLILPPIEYEPEDEVRKVQQKGYISFRGRELLVSKAFIGQPVALRALDDGVWNVYYCHQLVRSVDLRTPPPNSQV